jgi:ribonuclease BN (tRNA processing enzyme)
MYRALAGGNSFAREQMRSNSGVWGLPFRKALQRQLKDHGVYSGPLDGRFGPTTFAAIDACQAELGLGYDARPMQLTVIGCGDAFGAGGRLQTAFLVRSRPSTFLIDCGATTLIGMRRLGLQPNDVDTVFVTHLHGDHFGGLAWLLIDAQYVSRRTRPLFVAGPKGIEARFVTATEALYPNAATAQRRFELSFLEYEERTPLKVEGVTVVPFEVKHPSGAPPYALRFELEEKILAFTGDTGWVETLCEAARGADLFISECFQYDVRIPIHLDYKTIDANYERLAAKRVLLTHMGEAMLAASGRVDRSRYLIADDGMTIEL